MKVMNIVLCKKIIIVKLYIYQIVLYTSGVNRFCIYESLTAYREHDDHVKTTEPSSDLCNQGGYDVRIAKYYERYLRFVSLVFYWVNE